MGEGCLTLSSSNYQASLLCYFFFNKLLIFHRLKLGKPEMLQKISFFEFFEYLLLLSWFPLFAIGKRQMKYVEGEREKYIRGKKKKTTCKSLRNLKITVSLLCFNLTVNHFSA